MHLVSQCKQLHSDAMRYEQLRKGVLTAVSDNPPGNVTETVETSFAYSTLSPVGRR